MEKQAQKELDALQEEIESGVKAVLKQQAEENEKAKKAGKPVSEDWKGVDDFLASFPPRFLAKAKEYEKRDEAILFLERILWNNSHREIQNQAVDILLRDHVKSRKMENIAGSLAGLDSQIGHKNVKRLMDALLKETPHPEIRSAVFLGQASIILEDGTPSDEERKKGMALLRQVIETAPKSRAAEAARGQLFSMEHLQVGMPAPDIEGKDFDGKTFHLSDYKGKVIMLDFWGDW